MRCSGLDSTQGTKEIIEHKTYDCSEKQYYGQFKKLPYKLFDLCTIT